MKRLLIILLIFLCLCSLTSCKDTSLPLPEVEEGVRGELGIDKNINEKTIDNYLNRDDAVYRDMRMLKDVASFENIGGDSYLSGYVKGFEVVPYPYLCNVKGLPETVGVPYDGNTLFTLNDDGTYQANYEESLDIIEYYFPKDKIIFLMCGGGGYAGMTKNLLINLGYDATKIYDVGGYWYYTGDNKIEIKREENNKTYYDFHKVNYHSIVFDVLHPINGYVPKKNNTSGDNTNVVEDSLVDIDNDTLKKMIDDKMTFPLFIYLPGCTSCASFSPIVNEVAEGNDITFYKINYQLLDANNEIKEKIASAPSLFLFVNGQIKAFLNPNSDADLSYYKTSEALSTWINEFIKCNIVKTNTTNNDVDCQDDGCKIG